MRNFASAVAVSLALAFVYQTLTDVRPWSRVFASTGGTIEARRSPILRGRSVAHFGGYELNVAFTPDGEVVCVDISAAAPAPQQAAPPRS
jgi:hypothetical protein